MLYVFIDRKVAVRKINHWSFAMGRPGVTYADVAKTAVEIIEQGNVPTIERLRAKLETGSYSTLGSLLKEWKAKQALQQQYSANSQLPDELITAVQKVWEAVNEKTESQILKIEKARVVESQTLQEDIAQQKKIAAALQNSYQELNEKHRTLFNERTALEQALQDQKIQQATVLATLDGLEKQLLEKQSRIEELARLNQQAQNNLEHYRQASREQRLLEQQQYEARQDELEQRNHKLQENWTAILTENTKLKNEYEKLFLSHEKLKNDHSEIQKKLDERTEKLAEKGHLLGEKNTLLQVVESQQKINQEKIEVQQNKIIELEKITAASAERNKQHEEKIKELNAQNKILAHEKWILDREKAELITQVEHITKGNDNLRVRN